MDFIADRHKSEAVDINKDGTLTAKAKKAAGH
jgi:hypothetical protein